MPTALFLRELAHGLTRKIQQIEQGAQPETINKITQSFLNKLHEQKKKEL